MVKPESLGIKTIESISYYVHDLERSRRFYTKLLDFQEIGRASPELVKQGHLYLAQPPLYRLSAGGTVAYARDDAHRAELERGPFKGKKVEVSRFKGLGEMNPQQLKETTMDPRTRGMIRITLPQDYEDRSAVRDLVDRLMGRNPEHRFHFIQSRAAELDEAEIDA